MLVSSCSPRISRHAHFTFGLRSRFRQFTGSSHNGAGHRGLPANGPIDMMRSKKSRSPGPGQWLGAHPFFCLAVLAGLAFGALMLELPPESILQLTWNILGIGFHLAANGIARLLPDLPGWLDSGLVIALGLLPYLLADAVWERVRPV